MSSINELAENLKAKGYHVECFATKEEAADYMCGELHNTVIGIGGSQTVAQMHLFEKLSKENEVFWHDEKPEELSVYETRQKAFRAPVYISSVNAISLQGEIVNIDATGNRVAALSFGPEDIYLVIGNNKIAKDFDSALYRARNVAAPLNAKRLNRKTPCAAKADKCYDCNSPERICRNFSFITQIPFGAKYHIILIDEKLGY